VTVERFLGVRIRLPGADPATAPGPSAPATPATPATPAPPTRPFEPGSP
jgi:hypothetical protein